MVTKLFDKAVGGEWVRSQSALHYFAGGFLLFLSHGSSRQQKCPTGKQVVGSGGGLIHSYIPPPSSLWLLLRTSSVYTVAEEKHSG